MIGFIVNSTRVGLTEEINSLIYFNSLSKGDDSHDISFYQRWKSYSKIILYSYDLKSILIYLFSFIINPLTPKYLFIHEPFSFTHYVKKRENLIYSISYIFVREFLKLISKSPFLTPNLYASKRDGYFYVPLLKQKYANSQLPLDTRKIILFLGAKKKQRGLDFFNELKASAINNSESYIFVFFPDSNLKTTKQKEEILNKTLVVFNFYTTVYAQSGVSVDAHAAGIPVFHSEFEPAKDLMKSYGIFFTIERLSVSSFFELLNGIKTNFNSISKKCQDYHAFYHGEQAFLQYWYPILNS